MRILAFDGGLNFGYAAIGGAKRPISGSIRLKGDARNLGKVLRHADQIIRQLILAEKPDQMAFAEPFIGSIKGRPVQPDSIRPLLVILGKIDEIGDELTIPCSEWNEGQARRAFMGGVPRKSKDIKAAVLSACKARGYPCPDHHAADALCIASWALENEDPDRSHERTPIFISAGLSRSRSKK